MTSLSQQLALLVNRVHGGNRNAAARDIGVSQPTITRLLGERQGTEPNPSTEVLQKIAGFYGVTIDWLLTGKGETPVVFSEEFPVAEQLRFSAVIRGLGLTEATAAALAALPHLTLSAVALLAGEQSIGTPEHRARFTRILGAEYAHHTALIELLQDMMGPDDLRTALEQSTALAWLSFNPVAAELLRKRTVSISQVMDAVESSFLGAGFSKETARARSGKGTHGQAIEPGARAKAKSSKSTATRRRSP